MVLLRVFWFLSGPGFLGGGSITKNQEALKKNVASWPLPSTSAERRVEGLQGDVKLPLAVGGRQEQSLVRRGW